MSVAKSFKIWKKNLHSVIDDTTLQLTILSWSSKTRGYFGHNGHSNMSCKENSNGQRPVTKTVHEYASGSTVHGISYIFQNRQFVVERLLWILVELVAFTLVFTLSIHIYQSWKSNPVLTSVWSPGYPIEAVDFPSITICAQGSTDRTIG